MSGLPCSNCGKPTSDEDGKIFAEVFVCSTCYLMAERLYSKLQRELQGLLFILKDRIREYLTLGRLHYGPDTPLEDLSRKDLMQAIQSLEKSHDRQSAG